MMQGVGSQLSKHVLGMKFMRKTKDELDQSKLEEKHREHFAPNSSFDPTATTSTSSSINSSTKYLETIVKEVPSYAQVMGYNFGRISFGGFNPTVEYNVERGRWKAVHVHQRQVTGDEQSDTEPHSAQKQEADEEDEEGVDEPVYGSLIATCGKQIRGSKTRHGHQHRREEDVPLPVKKRSGWVAKGFRSESYNPDNAGNRGKKSRNQSQPPRKKKKFMKPSEDF